MVPLLRPVPAVAAVCVAASVSASPGHAQHGDFTPVTDATLRSPPDADWLQWRRTYDGWGYSPLAQITRDDVRRGLVGDDPEQPHHGRRDSYAVDGEQYVAVAAGGGTFGSYETLALTPELGLEAPTGGNTIFVFSLPDGPR